MSNELNGFQNYIKSSINFFNKHKKIIIWSSSALLALIVLVTAFISIRSQVSSRVSVKINDIMQEVLESRQVLEQDPSLTYPIEDLNQSAKELKTLYKKNSWVKNGVRALWQAANIKTYLGESEMAFTNYQTLYKKHSASFLAPVALVYAAIELENQAKFQEALDLYNLFEKKYQTHPYYGESRLGLARCQIALSQANLAQETLLAINENPNLEPFKNRANELLTEMSLLEGVTLKENLVPADQMQNLPSLTEDLQLQ